MLSMNIRSDILANHNTTRQIHLHNIPTNNLNKGMREFSEDLEEIFNNENQAFRINISFGMILRKVKTGEYRYFIPHHK